MELSIYDIIIGPVVSNKAYQLHQTLKKVTLNVHVAANKSLVKEAVTKLFNVEVESVRIMVRKGKRKVSRTRNISFDNTKKIAVISLKKDFNINLFGDIAQGAAEQVSQQPSSNTSKESAPAEGKE